MEKALIGNQVRLQVTTADDLRDALPISGVFDMNDCIVTIDCPLYSQATEVARMVTILESVIHVVDFDIMGHADNASEDYMILITEVPIERAEGRQPKKSKF
jgi:hypothetical protein